MKKIVVLPLMLVLLLTGSLELRAQQITPDRVRQIDSLLIPTSKWGFFTASMIALNGGFFNTKQGGSVTFLESDGAQVSTRSYDTQKQRDPDPFNGALIIGWDGKISIEPRQTDSYFLSSDLILMAVDGRAKKAAGMSLAELQSVLMNLGCKEAINLDGGGSTTLWIHTQAFTGIVNHPSDNKKFDKKGERSVANAIVISKIENRKINN